MSQILLDIKNLGFCLEDRWLFRNLEFSVPTCSFIAITGPSGVGKTTLLRSLNQQIPASEGNIHSSLSKGYKTSMIFQDLQLSNGASTLTNALSGCLSRHSSLRTLLGFPRNEKQECLNWLAKFGLENKSHQWASTLSRGERQRLAICRTLLSSPTLLLADEPVASLDSSWAIKTLKIIKDTQGKIGGSVVCSLHDEEQVRQFADFVLRLNPDNPEAWTWEKISPTQA